MRMRNLAWLLLAGSTLLAQPPSPSPPQSPAAPAGPADAVRAQPIGSMSDLMVKIIYPTSDAVFYISTRQPKTEAEWGELQGKTLALAESANLLMMPGRARDQDRWMQDAKLMLDAGRAAFRAARAKDMAALEAVNDALYTSCTSCHQHYRPNYGRRPAPDAAPPGPRPPPWPFRHPPSLPPHPPWRRNRSWAAGSFCRPKICAPTARSRGIRGASTRSARSSSSAGRATCRSCRAIRRRFPPAPRRPASR